MVPGAKEKKMKLQAGLVVGLAAFLLPSSALAQDAHDGFVWIEGPEEVLESNSTYTLEVWGRWESPLWVDGVSAMDGFEMDIFNVEGQQSVLSVSNVVLDPWVNWLSSSGNTSDNDIYGVGGGQLPPDFPQEPWDYERANPLRLFTFDFTTGSDTPGLISFTPDTPYNGGLAFMPDPGNGGAIHAPVDSNTALYLDGWSSTIPAPTTLWALGLGAGCLLVDRRRKET
jgi:hypothetical protein